MTETTPVTRGAHYRHAQRLLAEIGPDAYRPDIPKLIRALTHAVLASASDDAASEQQHDGDTSQ